MTSFSAQSTYGLIADIGGTNARFALVELVSQTSVVMLAVQKFRCADYPSLTAAVNAYIAPLAVAETQIKTATIAVAGALDGDWFEMTNNPWAFSIKAVERELALECLTVINDYTAIAWAISRFAEADYISVGGGQADSGLHIPVGIVGPGTGLGMGGYIQGQHEFIALQAEGGHATFAPCNEVEIEILHILSKQYSRVSNERLLSGPGLVNIYQALAEIENLPAERRDAAAISSAAIEHDDVLCVRALNQFCATLGSVAGDLALTLGARAGVYIAGGIVPRFVDFFQQSPFRKRFEAKGRFSAYNAAIPTRLITNSQPGLLGAAANQLALHVA